MKIWAILLTLTIGQAAIATSAALDDDRTIIEEAQVYIRTQGQAKGERLNKALIRIRKAHPDMTVRSDMEISKQIILEAQQ